MLPSQLLVVTNVYTNHKVNLARDFASISLIGTVPFVLVINPQVPAKSISELINLAKKSNPNGRFPLSLGSDPPRFGYSLFSIADIQPANRLSCLHARIRCLNRDR